MLKIIDRTAASFVKLFRTSSHYYLYNAHTNDILEMDILTWSNLLKSQNVSSVEFNNLLTGVLDCTDFNHQRLPQMLLSPWKQETIINELSYNLSKLTLCITEACNLRCDYCVYGKHYPAYRDHSDRMMLFETAKQAICFFLDRSSRDGLISIGFYGGEPLTRLEFIHDCMEFAKNYQPQTPILFSITTNGTLLNPEAVQVLVKYDASVLVSLDGPQEVHDRHRHKINGNGSFNLILNNLHFLNANYPNYYRRNVGFNVVLAPDTDVYNLYLYFQSHSDIFGEHRFKVASLIPYGTSIFDCIEKKHDTGRNTLRDEFISRVVQGDIKENHFLRVLFDKSLSRLHHRQHWQGFTSCLPPNGICLPGQRRLLVDVLGNFHICERVGADYKIGDINNGFDHDAINNLICDYITLSAPDCLKCWAVRLCDACFLDAFQGSLDVNQKHLACEKIRSRKVADLVLYCSILEINPRALDYLPI